MERLKTAKFILLLIIIVLCVAVFCIIVKKAIDDEKEKEPNPTAYVLATTTGDTETPPIETTSIDISTEETSPVESETSTEESEEETTTQKDPKYNVEVINDAVIKFSEDMPNPLNIVANTTGLMIDTSRLYRGIPSILVPYITAVPNPDKYVIKSNCASSADLYLMWDKDFLKNNVGPYTIVLDIYYEDMVLGTNYIDIFIEDRYDPIVEREMYLKEVTKEICVLFTKVRDFDLGYYQYVETEEALDFYTWTMTSFKYESENVWNATIEYKDYTGQHTIRNVRYYQKEDGKTVDDLNR